MIPVQADLYRYDKRMMQEINDENLNVSYRNLAEVNLVRLHKKLFNELTS